MDMNHLDNDFSRIEELFMIYKNALSHENNDALKEQIKHKIIVQFWKTIQKTKSISDEMKEFTDIIVKKVIYCLNHYPDVSPKDFCKLTFVSIKKAFKRKIDTETFELKTGMHISDQDDRTRKRIARAYKQFITFRSEDKNEFIEYAVLFLGFERNDLEEYLFPKQIISLFGQSKNDDEYCVVDQYIDTAKVFDNGDTIVSTDELEKQFKTIDELWLKQKVESKTILSELLTRELLVDFKKNNVPDLLINLLKLPNFINREMMESFLYDMNYLLPTQQEIGQKYGITKSAVSVKLTRFIEKLKDSINF